MQSLLTTKGSLVQNSQSQPSSYCFFSLHSKQVLLTITIIYEQNAFRNISLFLHVMYLRDSSVINK